MCDSILIVDLSNPNYFFYHYTQAQNYDTLSLSRKRVSELIDYLYIYIVL